MKNIQGIGGFFFRARDPEMLKKWYIDTLGLDISDYVWQQGPGPTVFEPHAQTTEYFPVNKQWMLNFRVKDLRSLILELQAKGLSVEEREEWNAMPEIGTFARIHDPEGNPIELWQPAG